MSKTVLSFVRSFTQDHELFIAVGAIVGQVVLVAVAVVGTLVAS
jgi:hypothetical protein